MFGNPASARSGRSCEADVMRTKEETRTLRRDGSSRLHNNNYETDSTPGAPLTAGRRQFSSRDLNGNPITPGRGECGSSGDGRGNGTLEQASVRAVGSYSSGRDHGSEDMLELEHIIGYTGHFLQTIASHPKEHGAIIKSVGALLVIGSISDPHEQQLLRGHDMEISALAVSPSGSLIATGECMPLKMELLETLPLRLDLASREKTIRGTGNDELVFLAGEWMRPPIDNHRKGIDQAPFLLAKTPELDRPDARTGVCRLSFSPDEKFLLGCGLDRLVYVWDTSTGELSRVEAKVFRASVPVCSAGMLSVCTDPATGAVYCGGGNGVIRKIVGADMVWRQELETRLDGGVVSLTVQADGCELLAGTQEGTVYRLLLSDLSASKASATTTSVSSSQKSPVVSVACGSRSDAFATCSQDGTVRVWDLSDFGVVAEALEGPRGRTGDALCVCWLGEEAVVSGWSDCSVRCHDAATGALRWELPNSHRASVTCCAVRFDSSASFLVTGAEDGSVSVWDLRTRELLLQFSEHQKGVRTVLVDVASPNLVHSVGADCTVLTYDLRKERRTVAHMTRAGAFQSMTQRIDSENELITCDVNGRLLMWDCDYREPVQAVQDPSQQRLSCVSVSPSGRYIVLGGEEETVKILDLANNCETVACGRAHAGSITSVQWTRDERQLISAADDCTLAIWNFFGASVSPTPAGRSS
eukprot:jgi/Undpi1/13949/HiC_scaffold_9.g03600.m1